MNPLAQTWTDPHARHAMLVHLPIALAMIGVVPVALLGLCGGISRPVARALRVAALACFLGASGGAVLAANAGHAAAAGVLDSSPPVTEFERRAVEVHRARGGIAWIWPLAPSALLALGLRSGPRRQRIAECAAFLASVGVAVWIGYIGHVGGRLVYVHGLGVPHREPVAETLARDAAGTGPEAAVSGEQSESGAAQR